MRHTALTNTLSTMTMSAALGFTAMACAGPPPVVEQHQVTERPLASSLHAVVQNPNELDAHGMKPYILWAGPNVVAPQPILGDVGAGAFTIDPTLATPADAAYQAGFALGFVALLSDADAAAWSGRFTAGSTVGIGADAFLVDARDLAQSSAWVDDLVLGRNIVVNDGEATACHEQLFNDWDACMQEHCDDIEDADAYDGCGHDQCGFDSAAEEAHETDACGNTLDAVVGDVTVHIVLFTVGDDG